MTRLIRAIKRFWTGESQAVDLPPPVPSNEARTARIHAEIAQSRADEDWAKVREVTASIARGRRANHFAEAMAKTFRKAHP